MIYQRMLEGLSLNKHKHSKAVVESNAIKTKLISISTTNGQFIGYFSVKEASKFLKISTTTLRTKLSNNNPIGNYLIKSYLPF